MKLTAQHSVKFSKLKRRLALPHWQTVGLLETLWLITQGNAPRGDIGRLSNEDIAGAMEWAGDANELIENLVGCGWLDESEEYRLVVHDWEDHLPTYLKGALAKHGKTTCAKQPAKQPAKHVAEAGQQPAPCLTLPNLGLPNLVKPSSCPGITPDDETASWIWELIHQMQPGRKPPNLADWANAIRLIRERDKRTDDRIREVFAWANNDGFWRANILNPDKLREKWDDLTLKMSIPAGNGRRTKDTSPPEFKV